MCGEHRGKPRALNGCPKRGQWHWAIRRVRPDQPRRQRIQGCDIGFGVNATNVGSNPRGAILERVIAQPRDHAGDGVEIKLAGVHATADRQRRRQNGIPERVGGVLVAQPRHQIDEFGGEVSGGRGDFLLHLRRLPWRRRRKQ